MANSLEKSQNTSIKTDKNSDRSGASVSQRDLAYEQLKKMLTLGQIPAGERLREPQWAQKLGVNRSAVREALVGLGAEGWLVRGEKTGFFVPVLDSKQVHEIMEIRCALESLAIDRAIATGLTNARHLAPLTKACDELVSLASGGYMLGCIEADRAFHQRLVVLSASSQLQRIYAHSPLPMVYMISVGMDDWQAEAQKTEKEHRQIVDDLSKGQGEKAKEKLYNHLVSWAQNRIGEI